jgi:hypothetical protein
MYYRVNHTVLHVQTKLKGIIMKYKMLSAVIATALLSACGNDGSGSSYDVKAFDPAVANMDVNYTCADGTSGTSGVTDGFGVAKVTANTPSIVPETCEFTLVGRSNSVDMSNGKSMAGVTYLIPTGMAKAGQIVTASPLSTLLAKKLAGAPYNAAAASQLLTDLGLDSLVTNGATIEQIFLDTEAAAEALPTAEKAKLLATTAVVSDTVVANPDATAETLTMTSKTVSDAVLEDYPSYPADSSGELIFLDVKETSKDVIAAPEAPVVVPPSKPAVPQNPEKPPTGGTGGTGGTSGNDSTGG